MLRGGRGIIAAFAGLAALFTALGMGAYFGALSAPHYGYQAEHPAYRRAQPKQGNPSQIDRDRAGLPYFAERIASGPDPANRNERENRDLAAQESMSVWAFWLLAVSAAGTVTTMIGTGFLLWQIILTREAVKDTGDATKAMVRQNEIAEQAQRPWLELEPILCEELTFDEYGARFDVTFRIKNVGNSPATNVLATAQLVPVPIGDEIDSEAAVRAVRNTLNNWRIHDRQYGRTVFPQSPQEQAYAAIAPNEAIMEAEHLSRDNVIYQLGIGVRYRFGEGRGETVYGFTIVDLSSDRLALPRGRGVLGGNIRLDDTYTGYAT